MHTRPLLGGDFAAVFDFINSLSKDNPIDWNTTLETRHLIEKDPVHVFTLKIPTSTFNSQNNLVMHNLPVPDFDETGFIGRIKDVDDVKQLVLSNKVVTVLGDGGIGKTALALKVAYDIVDMNEKCPFELIIWTTAKTTMLTAKGIQEIYTTITDYTGLIDVISETLEINQESNKLSSILEYLSLFKTLLIIDNLETIHSEEVRDFIRNAQVKCNVLITSRIGLGELEFPRKLNGLSESESSKLIREIARIRNSETLIKLPHKTLVEISEKLYFNPLALKWFVNTVEMGISPKEVLANKDYLLNFCLTNVYDKLSNGALDILRTIRSSRRKLTTGEIIYLSEYEPIEVRKFLIELFKTTLINREINDPNNLEDVYYYISDFAKEFLTRKYFIDPEYVKRINKRYKALEESVKDIVKYNKYNEFAINSLTYSNSNQKISAKFLSEALIFSKSQRFDKALERVIEAKNIDPNYSEVYRVSAFIKATQGDILGAEEDYEIGLEIDPNNLRLLYYYAQFLLFILEDVEKSLKFATLLYKEKPNHPYTVLLFARCYNKLGEYGRAVEILNGLLLVPDLDVKNVRVTYTELISLYANIGQNLLKVETDIANGISNFKKAFETFEICIEKGYVDFKLIKHFVESLYSFINLLPTTEKDNCSILVKSLIEKYIKQISLMPISDKLILKYSDKFEDESLKDLVENYDKFENSRIGNIRKNNVENNFVFIEADNDRFYANRADFIDLNAYTDWIGLKNGQLVAFQIGENAQGKCAKFIKLM